MDDDEVSMETLYYRGILSFSYRRFEEIARQVVHRLQRVEASGIYGDDFHHKTLWDEYCHEIHEGPTPMVEDAMRSTVEPIIDELARSLPVDEAALLSLSNAYFDLQLYDSSSKPEPEWEYLLESIFTALNEVAGSRSMHKFDPNAN